MFQKVGINWSRQVYYIDGFKKSVLWLRIKGDLDRFKIWYQNVGKKYWRFQNVDYFVEYCSIPFLSRPSSLIPTTPRCFHFLYSQMTVCQCQSISLENRILKSNGFFRQTDHIVVAHNNCVRFYTIIQFLYYSFYYFRFWCLRCAYFFIIKKISFIPI